MSRTFGCSESDAESIFYHARFCWNILGMRLQRAEKTRSTTRTDVRDVDGTIISGSEREHGFRDEATATWKAAASFVREPGSYMTLLHTPRNGWSIDEVTFSTAKGQKLQLTLRAHAHRKTENGSLCTHQSIGDKNVEIRPFSWFGASTFGWSLGVAAASLQSGSYTVRFLHKDAEDEEGNWLCGKTYGAVAAATFEAIDDDTNWTIPYGWTLVRAGEAERNAAFGRRTLSIEKTLW